MFGIGKSVGVLNDIINNRKVFAASSTKYAFVDVKIMLKNCFLLNR